MLDSHLIEDRWGTTECKHRGIGNDATYENQTKRRKPDIIFEGTIVSLVPGDSGVKKDGNYTEEALFEVIVPWKGVQKGDRVTILRNSYWGDRSSEDLRYLVVSQKETISEWLGLKKKTVYRAPHCKHTLHVPYTEENIAVLKAYFAESQR